jgi:uncharacterized RDD family membrane protein YckC
MSDDYTLLTPENVDLRFDVAGLGSRGAAALIDYTIILVGYFILTTGGSFVVGLLFASGSNLILPDGTTTRTTLLTVLGYGTIALVTLLTFFGWWGYFILTEMIWNGQSIGKRRLGLRVVRTGGRPVSVTASLVRNLLRIVDLFLLVGVAIMIVDGRSRRLGDIAAGTLVIRESRGALPKDLAAAFRPVEIPPVSAHAVDDFPSAERLGMEHYTLVRDYFARRSGMSASNADRLASDLAARLAASIGVDRSTVRDPVAFLAAAARAFEARHRNGGS